MGDQFQTVGLEHSLQNYWDMHAEAIARCKGQAKSPQKGRVKASYLKQLEDKIPEKA